MSTSLLASKISCLAVIGSGVGMLLSDAARAQPYPSRPVKIVTQAAAGSAIDVLLRVVSNQMAKSWTSGVVIENRAGAGGALAAGTVAGAAKDGYTLLHAAASLYTVYPAESAKPALDPDRDLVPVAYMGDLPLVIAVPKSQPSMTLGQLIGEARKAPGVLNVGTNGTGTFPWLAATLLIEKAGAPMTIVPYARGGAPAILNDILGGRLHVTVEAVSGLKGAVESGELRPLAVTTASRLPGLPNLPTAAETVPGFTALGWSVLAAPAGTPEAVMNEIDRAVKTALADAKVREQLANLSVYPRTKTATELRQFITTEQQTWWPRVRAHAATASSK